MSTLKVFQIKSKFLGGSFDQNTYVVMKGEDVILIDVGAEVDDIKKIVKNKKVLAVLITHIHFDHIFNIEKIVSLYDCPVYIQSGFGEKFYDGYKNASFLIGSLLKFNVQKDKIQYYKNNFSIGKINIEIIKTSGHSSDGVCIKIDKNLFTGDTVFCDCIGRCDFYDSSEKEMIKSLKIIKDIDFEIAYPGHFDECDKNQILKTISFYTD